MYRQEEAARQKRKRREAKLKEQKETADARKRRKVVDAKPADEKDTPASDEDDATPASTEVVTLPKSKAPALLPTSLLEKITDRPSAPSRSHKRAADFGIIDEDASDDDMDMDGLDDFDFGDDAGMGEEMALMIAEKNRKKRLARKAKMEFKKGPVTVKVLKDEKKLRKIMMPPANKKVANTKESWLNGRGVVKRRAIGGGIRGAFK